MADRRGLRQLFKRPRNFLRWPPAAYGLIALLVAVVVVMAVAAVVFRPPEIPPPQAASSDRWAAEGAAFGGGAFLLAVLATAIAVIAYVNSTERPALRLEADYLGREEPLPINWNILPADGPVTLAGEYRQWLLSLQLYNDGPVAARFVAIHVVAGPGVRLELRGGRPDFLPWHPPVDLAGTTDDLRWEGGADVVIHPSWPYRVPTLSAPYLALYADEDQLEFTFDVEVVADDVLPFRQQYVIGIDPPPAQRPAGG